jgi:uncharacterized protein YegJ (DUF2314 family)
MHSRLRHALFAASALIAALVGCRSAEELVSGEAGNIEMVTSDDPDMNAAIEQARSTLDEFIESLHSPSPTQVYFSVKAGFPYDGTLEHIWLDDVSFDGQDFHGVLGNEPIYLDGLHLGDEVTVSTADVSDWMIVDGGRLLGGFTIHVLRSRMSDEERQQFDQDMGLLIGDQPELP